MIDAFLARVSEWAARSPGVRGLLLVGSHARGEARPDSDVDLILLCDSVTALVADPSWTSRFGPVTRIAVEDWGRVTSIRAWYDDGREVEFALATLDWATRPDAGTRRVLEDGYRVLLDREGVLGSLELAATARPSR